MNQNIFKKFSENLKKTLIVAEKIAIEQKTSMGTDHQLTALCLTKENLASEILISSNIYADQIQSTSLLFGKEKSQNSISDNAKKAIEQAVHIASKYNHSLIDCEHLLLAILSNKEYNSYKIVKKINQKPEEITEQIEVIFNNAKEKNDQAQPQEPIFGGFFDEIPEEPMIGPMRPGIISRVESKKESFLEMFTTNLTALAAQNKLDPVVGRNTETERMIQILSRRTKNNPILVGEPGVGKTAIVEGLAQRISNGKIPNNLLGHEILSLDMGALIAGTMYRGQFESRVKRIIAEIKKKSNIILFIDEIHTVIGAGSTEGSIDAANLLKPMLARGELRLIGSTTFDEYKKHIEKDTAFERRLQPIKINEPTEEETIAILNGIKTNYEKHHKVRYLPQAIEAAVMFSKRYINDRFLPDKAIDLLDEVAASTQVVSTNAIKLAELKKDLRDILKQKDELILTEKYKEAVLLREREIAIEKQIDTLQATNNKTVRIIDEEDIAKLVSLWTGIPVSGLSIEEKKKYLDLEKNIKKSIIGQNEAVNSIVKAIKRARVGISNPNRPAGSFIFLGPTGVGKSELAKVIAREILGSEKSLIKIDMSEFMERHNVSRLIGAPAGYIGYEEGGKLTETVRKNPYSVILLDEIEKANPEVFNILLQVMEDGELTDAKGRKIDFKNAIIIMTSNLGTESMLKNALIGFTNKKDDRLEYEKIRKDAEEAIEKHFKPEFLNRVDKIIVFKPLDKDAIKKISELELRKLKKRLGEQKIKLSFSSQVVSFITNKGYDPKFGARPIRKIISDFIETPLSEGILTGEFTSSDQISIKIKKDMLVFDKRINKS